MRSVELDPRTLRRQRAFTAAALLFAGVAAAAPLAAGGVSLWFRWIAGAVTMLGTLGACRFRNTLHLPMISALGAAALLPDDATIGPPVVAAITAVSMLLCAETVAVARRLVTAAPVRSVLADVRALSNVATASALAVACVAALAQLERPGSRFLVVGLPVAVAAIAVAVLGALPLTADPDR